jgi:hypothetical protein
MEAGNAVEAIVAGVPAAFEVPASVAGVLWALAPGAEAADDAGGGRPPSLRPLYGQSRR